MRLRAITMTAAMLASLLVATPASATVTLPPGTITLPTSGSYLYLNSEAGDYIGQGQEQLLTPANATMYAGFRLDTFGAQVTVDSYTYWYVTIAAPAGVPLAVGSYTGAGRGAFRPAGSPGLEVYGTGRGCNTITGQFDVNELVLSSLGDITRFDAVFEQHCEGLTPALYGRIHIESPAPAPGATLPPGALTLPATGSFFYQMWDTNVGSGAVEQLFTSADSVFDATLTTDTFHSSTIQGNYTHWWYTDIAAALGGTLTVGHYANAVRTISRTATSPGVDVYGDGIGCNQVTGWFDVDQLDRGPGGELRTFQATFHEYCDNSIYQRHGRVRIELAPPPPPPPTLAITLDAVGKASNKTGIATISGTMSCSRSVMVTLSGNLTQVKPDHSVVQGTFSNDVYCEAPGVSWAQTVVGNAKFGASASTADVTVTNCESGCTSASASGTVKLNSSK